MQQNRIALVGLDGSGKSANIDRMKKDLDYSNCCFVWVRWEPKLLAPVYWLLSRKLKKEKRLATTNAAGDGARRDIGKDYERKSHIKKQIFQSRIVRWVWLKLAIFDYFLQFYAKVLGLLRKEQKLIFDRYFFDLFVDQGLNFGCTPKEISSMISKNSFLFPRVHKTVYIKATPETCFERKNDIPNMEYLLKRYSVYEQLSKDFGWYVVNGEDAFEDVYCSIKQTIMHSER